MARGFIKRFLVICICLCFAVPAFAQEQQKEEKKMSGTRRQLATIVFAGLGGAVLGLSTLSFYGRPQDYLSNIAIGFAVGIIGGFAYSTYNTTKDPKKVFGEEGGEGAMILQPQTMQQAQIPLFQYQWQF